MAETLHIPKEPTVEETITSLRSKDPELLRPDHIRGHFSDVLESVYYAVREGYLAVERKETDRLREKFIESLPVAHDRESFRRTHYKAVMAGMKLESKLRPIRMSRAKDRFEDVVQRLFVLAGIPCERVSCWDKKRFMGRVDIIVPDKRTYLDTPGRARLLYLEATLKGRWHRISNENGFRKGPFLVTILRDGERISEQAVQRLVGSNLILYVPDRVKKDRFRGKNQIRGLSDLPSDLVRSRRSMRRRLSRSHTR